MKKISNKKLIINIAIIILVTGFVVFYLVKNKTITWDSIKQLAWYQFVIVFAYFLLGLALWATIDHLVYNTVTNKFSAIDNLMTVHFGHLGSSVTPFRSGHFPLMAYYEHAKGLTLNETATALTKVQIVYSISTIFAYSILFVYFLISKATVYWQGSDVPLWIVILVGIGFHVLVFIGIVILAFNKKVLNWILVLLAKIIGKFKKTFDKDVFIQNGQNKFELYRSQIKSIFTNFHKFIIPCLIYFLLIVAMGTTQYISYLVISGEAFSFSMMFEFLSLHLAVTYISNIIPIPGGVGTSEVMFGLIFQAVIPSTIIGSVLVVWRVSTLYIPIIYETILYLNFSIRYNKKILKEKNNKLIIESSTSV